mmetsp:Transcript_16090/g.39410  ORF Transcript_16090/g.39410 Transcript_16090/m.39410 type:complete len:80 (-) Transcript_16090:23-262(-)
MKYMPCEPRPREILEERVAQYTLKKMNKHTITRMQVLLRHNSFKVRLREVRFISEAALVRDPTMTTAMSSANKCNHREN